MLTRLHSENCLPKLTLKQIEEISDHSCPKAGTYMLIDISPNDAHQYFKKNPIARLSESLSLYKDIYKTFSQYCTELIVAREVDSNGRIHYHANAIIKEPYYLSSVIATAKHKLEDRILYAPIYDINYRTEYIKKDKDQIGYLSWVSTPPPIDSLPNVTQETEDIFQYVKMVPKKNYKKNRTEYVFKHMDPEDVLEDDSNPHLILG